MGVGAVAQLRGLRRLRAVRLLGADGRQDLVPELLCLGYERGGHRRLSRDGGRSLAVDAGESEEIHCEILVAGTLADLVDGAALEQPKGDEPRRAVEKLLADLGPPLDQRGQRDGGFDGRDVVRIRLDHRHGPRRKLLDELLVGAREREDLRDVGLEAGQVPQQGRAGGGDVQPRLDDLVRGQGAERRQVKVVGVFEAIRSRVGHGYSELIRNRID